MLAELERLHEAISAVQALELGPLTNDERHELTVGLFTETNRLAGARSRVLAEWVGAAAWARGGALSPSQRLASCVRLPVGFARAEVARARSRDVMPAAHTALSEGRIGLDHLRLLAAANQPTRNDAFRRDESMLVGFCSSLSFPSAKAAIDYWCQRVDATGSEKEGDKRVAANRLHLSQSLDGCWFLDGRLDPLAGTIVDNELRRLVEQLRHDDERAGVVRTPAQRRAAALVRMAERSASTPEGAKNGRVLAHVFVGEDSLARLCELANGTVIAPGQLMPYLDRTAFDTLLFDGPSTVVSVTRTRTFTGAVRTAVMARDRHCQHPAGCDTAADRCDVDHVIAYARGGATSQFNGRLQCPAHNRLAHLHDADAEPLPHRDLTRLDELTCRVRHHLRHRQPLAADHPTWHTIRIRARPSDWNVIHRHRRRRPSELP